MGYLEFTKEIATKAGKLIKDNFSLGMERRWKEGDSPVTVTDIAINQIVIDLVKNTYPGHSVLAEEGDYFSEKSEYTWVCDPLDGTWPFSHGIPVSTFSLALVKNGVTLVGVIYDPFMDRMFFAEKGKGAFLNGKSISVSEQKTVKKGVVGSVYWNNAPVEISGCINKLRASDAKIIDLCSIAYMGALVACGELVATIFPNNAPHDSAALSIIIEEAGGKITDIYGNTQRYDKPIKGFIASNGYLHDQLVEMMKNNKN